MNAWARRINLVPTMAKVFPEAPHTMAAARLRHHQRDENITDWGEIWLGRRTKGRAIFRDGLLCVCHLSRSGLPTWAGKRKIKRCGNLASHMFCKLRQCTLSNCQRRGLTRLSEYFQWWFDCGLRSCVMGSDWCGYTKCIVSLWLAKK